MGSLETLLGERKDESAEITTYGAKKEDEQQPADGIETATPKQGKSSEVGACKSAQSIFSGMWTGFGPLLEVSAEYGDSSDVDKMN